MKHISNLLLFSIASSALAQPTLTFNTNAPQPGSSYELRTGPYIAPGNAGALQVWDFSQLTTDSSSWITRVLPGASPYSASFPAATVGDLEADTYAYYRTASDGLYFIGSAAENVPIPYTDEARHLPYPCTYQTTWSDAFAGSFEIEDMAVAITGTITGVADGHGTLILPGGTVENVLRIHWTREMQQVSPFFTIDMQFDSYLYFAPGRSHPIVQTVQTTSTVFGEVITTAYTQWVDEVTTTVEDPTSGSTELDLYPVPTNGELNFSLPASFSGMPVVTITDANGRSVRGTRNLTTHGFQGRMDVSALPAGIYQLTAIDELGQRATARFVVQ